MGLILGSVLWLALVTARHASAGTSAEFPSLLWSSSSCVEGVAGPKHSDVLRSFFTDCAAEAKFVLHTAASTNLDLLKSSGAFDPDQPPPFKGLKSLVSSSRSSVLISATSPLTATEQLKTILDVDIDDGVDVFSDCQGSYRLESPRVRRFPLAALKDRPEVDWTVTAVVDLACVSPPIALPSLLPSLGDRPSAFIITPADAHRPSPRRMTAEEAPKDDSLPQESAPVLPAEAPLRTEDSPMTELATTSFTLSALLTLFLTFSLMLIGFRCMSQIDTPTRYEERCLQLNKEY